jgi:hypothetical protein
MSLNLRAELRRRRGRYRSWAGAVGRPGQRPCTEEEGQLRSRGAPRAPTDLATASPVTRSGNIDSRPTRDGALTTADDLAGNVGLGRCIRAALGGHYREPRSHHESFELTKPSVGRGWATHCFAPSPMRIMPHEKNQLH